MTHQTSTRTMTGKMMAAIVDLRIQRTAKHVICTRVKRCTRRSGTWRRNTKSGWCLAGMKNSFILSQNWTKQGNSGEISPPPGHQVPKLKLSLITSTWLHLIISKIFMILHHSCCCYTLYNLFAHSCLYYYLLGLQYTVLHILFYFIFLFFTTLIFMYILLCLCNYNCTVHGADLTYISLFCLYSV